jgi:queuosine precursor transporter
MKKELLRNPEITAVQNHKYIGTFGMVWVTMLLVTMFTTLKTFDIFGLTFIAAAIGYPLTYIFADIFTEVYGYRVSRRIIWTGLLCVMLATSFAYLYTLLPASVYFDAESNKAFNLVFQTSPVIALGTVLAFWVGEFVNSFVLAKMKVLFSGRYEWARYILSTFLGQSFDNFTGVATILLLSNLFSVHEALIAGVTSTIFCTLWEAAASPVTHPLIRMIKEKEGLDTYDHGTKFNPFVRG